MKDMVKKEKKPTGMNDFMDTVFQQWDNIPTYVLEWSTLE